LDSPHPLLSGAKAVWHFSCCLTPFFAKDERACFELGSFIITLNVYAICFALLKIPVDISVYAYCSACRLRCARSNEFARIYCDAWKVSASLGNELFFISCTTSALNQIVGTYFF